MREVKASTILDINATPVNYSQVANLVKAMTHGNMNEQRFRHFVHMTACKLQAYATPEQLASLLKLHDIGWMISKVVWNQNDEKVALAVNMADGCAWLLPNGKLERPTVNRTTVSLPNGWTKAESA